MNLNKSLQIRLQCQFLMCRDESKLVQPILSAFNF